VLDNATPQDPQALSSGISRVWVNGVEVYADGRETGARPGRFIARGGE
jgi:N-acyl-D-amino-acid deacylase